MKKLLGVLIITSFVLVSCAHKDMAKTDGAGCQSKEAHVCTAACDHSAHKSMAKNHECSAECQAKWMSAHMEKMGADHVCTDECKVAHMAKHKADHKCSAECQAKWMSAHMEKMGAEHVCTDECKVAHMTMHKADHKCSAECKAECKAAHMEKMGADHVCTDACKAECKMKKAPADEAAGEGKK